MSEWNIRIPHRTMHDSLVDVAAWCRALDGPNDEAQVTRQIVLDERVKGLKTAGGLITFVESLTAEQRREVIDEARSSLDLPSTAEVEASEPPTRHLGLANAFPICEHELPPHMRGLGLGQVLT